MVEEKPAEANTGRCGGKRGFVLPQDFRHAKGRAGLAMSLLCCWAPSAATRHHRERISNFSFRQGSALSEEAFGLEREGQGCVTVLWAAAHLAACLTWVKHTLSFVCEEIQHPAVKQQVFPKTAFCNAAGMKHQYFFQRVSFTKTLQTRSPSQAREVHPGCPGLTSNQPSL